MNFDVFISYKRKSLPTANNLYYRLTTRGYSTFFDLEEMRRDNFNTQLLNYIENAKDVFVILEEGSLDACLQEDWEKDWFCHEIAFALEKGKNIIPIRLNGFKMPPEDFFPDALKDLHRKQSPEFSFSYFKEYLDKLIEKGFLLSKPNLQEKATSVFKFYSNENCQVFKEGRLVCSLEGMSDIPYYLPVPRMGDYRFKAINPYTEEIKELKEHIKANADKDVEIIWSGRRPLNPEQSDEIIISGDSYIVDLHSAKFKMIRVEGCPAITGGVPEHDKDEEPHKSISLPTFYIGEYPITQEIWEIVMGYNQSTFKEEELLRQERYKIWKRIIKSNPDELDDTFRTQFINFCNETLKQNNSISRTKNNSKKGDSDAKGFYKCLSSFMPKLQTKNTIPSLETPKQVEQPNLLPKDLSLALLQSTQPVVVLALMNWFRLFSRPFPVENISHTEAVEFVNRLSVMTNIRFSLPTEEEWEYAARGGQKSQGFKYSGSDNIDKVAWYSGNSKGSTHPVGEKEPNELHLYDMSGNVCEWTETPVCSKGSKVEKKGTAFFLRGGSWTHEANNCLVSFRCASNCSKKTSGFGLRVVIRENIK